MSALIDLTGRRFGTLVVIRRERPPSASKGYWVCRCDCGSERKVDGFALRKGRTKNCGCSPAYATHRLTNHPLYWVWAHMKTRCGNPNSDSYKWYGARGISVCAEWIDNPEAFIRWGEAAGYRKGLQLDRRDNDGNYEPGNCRWATPQQNVANSRKAKLLPWKGRMRTEREIARMEGIPKSTLNKRVHNLGMTIEQAVRYKRYG